MPVWFLVLFYLMVFIYGAVFGSFTNVCIYRVPAKEDIISRSHCMSCGQTLRWYDLVPIVSYLVLKGKCRTCGAKISAQYPLVEAISGALYVVIFMVNGINITSIVYCLMTTGLIMITVVDERTMEIPGGFNIFLAVLGVVMCVLDFEHIWLHIIGALAVSVFLLLLYLFSRGKAIGGGDIKLMAAAGLILGWKLIILAFFAGCILGAVIHLIRMRVSNAKRVLALGPYLSAGILIAALWGNRFLDWYLGMLT